MKFKLTDKERDELRGIFPEGFPKVISVRLNDAGMKPQRADKYTPRIIRDVFHANQADFNVLLELFRYKDEILTKEQELKKLRDKYKPEPSEDPEVPKTQ
jgi:hypothetical protein